MPHNVRMPDGTIVRNVPDGTTKAQLMARYGKAPKPKMAGFGHGLADSVMMGFLDEAGAVVDSLVPGQGRPTIWGGNSFGDAYSANVKQNRQVLRKAQADDPTGFLTGQVGGAFTPLPGGKVKAVAALDQRARLIQAGRLAGNARKAKAAAAAASVAPDVARGAVYGAGSAEGGLVDRARGAGKGAVYGLGGNVAGRAVGKGATRALQGRNVSPAVREVAGAGIVMTPGRRGGRVKRTFEESVLGSLPFVKAIPRAANERSVAQLNVAIANKALEPIGVKFPMRTAPGHDFNGKVQQIAYDAYDKAVEGLSLRGDSALSGAVSNILKTAPAKAGPLSSQLDSLIGLHLAPLTKGPVSGPQVRSLLSELRGDASKYAASASANERALGDALWDLHRHLDSALARQNGKGAPDAFKAAREAVTRVKRFSEATAKAKGGIASPGNFAQAMKKRGFGTTTDKVSRGEARMQKLADAAHQVLPDITPNSGTPERLFAASLATGGPSGIAAFFDPTMGALTAAPMAGYVPGIDRFLQKLALDRPDLFMRAGDAFERATPALGTAGTMTALGVSQQP